MSTQEKLEMMVTYAQYFIKTPYVWGGNNFSGYDCSGFVQEALASIGLDPKGDQSAQTLYDYFSTRWDERINRGSLLFFGRSKREITHTAIAVSKNFMIEAGGGGHLITNESTARAANAFIRIRPIDMRKDLIAGLFPREEL